MNNYLQQARQAWDAHEGARRRRLRYKRYSYGDQWSDMVRDHRGRLMREAEMIRLSGQQPLTNNLIRRMIKAIIGRWRSLCAETRRYDGVDTAARDLNDLVELDCRMLEEFLISGCAIQRVSDDCRPTGSGVWVDNVSPDNFFVEDFRDPRGHDISLLGMLHDMTPGEVSARFCGGDRARAAAIAAHYKALDGHGVWPADDGGVQFDRARRGRWRVIELWTLEPLERAVHEGDAPWGLDFRWHCRWMSPTGLVLAEYDSPWEHASHPFVLRFYPLTDGEVHPFVEDVIDGQHYINRVMVLMDKMLDSSAKGVLLFPEGQKPKSVSWDDIANNWASPDGIIPITDRTLHLPQQINSAASDSSAHRLLELELKLFEDTSGVSAPLMGQGATGSNGGSALFEAQVRQATSALSDVLETFAAFIGSRDAKIESTRR